MQEDIKTDEPLSPEIQDVMRNLVSAIRAVKLYPPNNPVYTRSVKKSYEVLDHFLKATPEFRAGVQKTYFTYLQTPIGKDAQLNKTIAQDLFAKGVREIICSEGVTEEELLALCQALVLSTEELAMRSGISTILWEKSLAHVKVIEAGLDEVITTRKENGLEDKAASSGVRKPSSGENEKVLSGRTLVLGDILADPSEFGASMVERAKQTRSEHESVEDRLFTLYQEAGRKIREEQPDQSDALFEGLAKSALSLEPPYRSGLIAGKLYTDLDSELMNSQSAEFEEQEPTELHEVITGRFSDAWTVQQVASLLKKTSVKKSAPPSPPPSPEALEAVPIPQELLEMARDLTEYTPEEMAAIKVMSEAGMESDTVAAAVRTLISLLPLARNPHHATLEENELSLFSGVVHQLENMLSYLLQKKNYDLAAQISQAFHTIPVDPAFKARMAEALKRTVSKTIIAAMIAEMRKSSKDSSIYRSAHAYLAAVEREATEIMLELLADETDRSARIYLLDLVKDLGKNQITLFGERLSDGRWYFVRNIVNILGEIKTEQAIAFLRKAAEHKNIRIRQEVVRALISIGGKKAAGIMAKLVQDTDADIQLMAIRGFADTNGIGAGEAGPLVAFLENRPLKRKEQELTLEAIKTLGKIGGPDAVEFLKRFTHTRWWKSRQLQAELRDAALKGIEEITRREGHGGRAQ